LFDSFAKTEPLADLILMTLQQTAQAERYDRLVFNKTRICDIVPRAVGNIDRSVSRRTGLLKTL